MKIRISPLPVFCWCSLFLVVFCLVSGFSKLVLQSVYSLSCVAPEICVLLAWWLPCILPEFFKYLEAKKKKKKNSSSLCRLALCGFTSWTVSQVIYNSAFSYLLRAWRSIRGESLGSSQGFPEYLFSSGNVCGVINSPVYVGAFKSPYPPMYFLSLSLLSQAFQVVYCLS